MKVAGTLYVAGNEAYRSAFVATVSSHRRSASVVCMVDPKLDDCCVYRSSSDCTDPVEPTVPDRATLTKAHHHTCKLTGTSSLPPYTASMHWYQTNNNLVGSISHFEAAACGHPLRCAACICCLLSDLCWYSVMVNSIAAICQCSSQTVTAHLMSLSSVRQMMQAWA